MTSRVFVVRRSPLARPLTAVAAATLVAGALTACSGAALDGGCEPVFDSGAASSIVTASGPVGDSAAVEFPTPLIAAEVQRSVLEPGSGEPAAAGATISYAATHVVGATGEVLAEFPAALISADDRQLGLGEALQCAAAGSRLVIAGPAEQIDARYAGIAETLVVVVDVLDVFLGKANGVNQLPQDGMPQVVTAVNGEPGITLTYQEAPSEPRWALIKAGGGAVIEDGDSVVAHVRSWSWPTAVGGSAILGEDTWASGIPQVLDFSADVLTDETIYDALDGAKVGSQILVALPNADESKGATVFVIDILGIVSRE